MYYSYLLLIINDRFKDQLAHLSWKEFQFLCEFKSHYLNLAFRIMADLNDYLILDYHSAYIIEICYRFVHLYSY